MGYGTQPSACPLCGSTADVRTVRELVDMLGQMYEQAMQARQQYQRQPRPPGRDRLAADSTLGWESPDQQIADAVLSAAARMIGKAIGKRVQQTYEERIRPALDAQREQSRQELLAIAARYPELRGCMRDQVIFLAGGTRTVPLGEISSQITLAQADAVVARLRA